MALTNYLLIASFILAIPLAVWLANVARVFSRYRGKMIFICPETGKNAAGEVDSVGAARASLAGRPLIHLQQCSRWPERQGCGQECLSQLGADPHNCLVLTKVADWYRGRKCVYCYKTFGEVHWHDHRPALVGPDRKTIQWSDVRPEKLLDIFQTHFPVCWSCHIAETFRREHPQLVVDRPANRGPMGELLTSERGHGPNGAVVTPNTRRGHMVQ
jgi:hypothetical protein